MLARIRVMHTARGHLSRETWRVSIRAVPKNYLIYQGNPDDGLLLELLGGLITAGPGHEIDGLPSTAPEILPSPLGFDTDLPTEYGMVY